MSFVLANCTSQPSNERHITRAEMGDAWPFTVVEGMLACENRPPRQAVVFRVGIVSYSVNGAAKTLGYPAIDPIWRENTQGLSSTNPTIVQRLAPAQRKAIFAARVGSEEAARMRVEQRYPQTDPRHPEFDRGRLDALLTAKAKYEQTLGEICKSKLSKAHELSDTELRAIGSEGAAHGWPRSRR